MNNNLPDINLLLVFEAIYNTCNISHAAQKLGRSQPTVSNALARLRKQLGDPLFTRSGQGVAPTPRAKRMIGPVSEALQIIRKSVEPVQPFNPKTTRRNFRLIFADPIEIMILPDLLRLIGDGPISLELQPPQILDIEDSLVSENTDLAIFPFPSHVPGLNCEPLCPVDLVVLARKDHPRIHGKISVKALQQEGHIALALRPGIIANLEKIVVSRRFNKRNICVVNRLSSMPTLVATTDLIGFAPRLFAQHFAKTLDLQILEVPVKLDDQPYCMIWHKRNEADDGHIWLRRRVREIVASTIQSD